MKSLKVYFISPLAIILSLLFIFILSFAITFTVKSTENYSKLDKTIIIDAGHGGIDVGANKANILEKDINLAIAKKLDTFFDDRGNIKTIMIRTEDELYEDDRNKDIVHRAELIQESKADILISIHVNSFPSSQSFGGQTFYKPKSEKSKELANFVQEKLVEIQPKNYRRIKEGPYYILRKSKIPSVIVEVGFISNLEDRKRISNSKEQDKIAKGIGEGIINYLNHNLKINPQDKPSLGNNNIKNSIKLYFGDYSFKGEEKLSSEEINLKNLKVINLNNISPIETLATHVIKELLKGPHLNHHFKLIPNSTKLLEINIIDKIAYINFNQEFISNNTSGIGEWLKIRSVIKTMTQIPGIEKVQLLVEGKHLSTSHFFLNHPLN
ncbi:N-acetylmuramoyl-L-alanine amidase [Orenia marismortui]|uniref:N-acetylmuramoyl-L-alanine amidase n=1 Tax=Orenia marismortui TaxID=46469 RepID=A0A4R8GLR4_9FIRM|nr:N-acetylmuramoyl-L-alanine amidase [Orenia marismortui]TDX46616.1 N-acetylmuramoyl-L-alanine amidase [Orenia marismortui]